MFRFQLRTATAPSPQHQYNVGDLVLGRMRSDQTEDANGVINILAGGTFPFCELIRRSEQPHSNTIENCSHQFCPALSRTTDQASNPPRFPLPLSFPPSLSCSDQKWVSLSTSVTHDRPTSRPSSAASTGITPRQPQYSRTTWFNSARTGHSTAMPTLLF